MQLLTYPEAIVVGLLQGVTELFPVSSLGHSVLLPALIGGRWGRDLDVSAPESPYLAFVVGLHVATALALLLFYWRDWVRIVGGFFTSIRYRRITTPEERLAWMIILATIPVGITGLLLEHTFRTVLGRPVPAAVFLTLNGLILLGAERLRRRAARAAEAEVVVEAAMAEVSTGSVYRSRAGAATAPDRTTGDPDERLAAGTFWRAVQIGSAQVLALLPGISRSGATMGAGLLKGLSHEDSARFSFLLATPVILAAGVLKLPDLFGPLGSGIHGQVLAGSAASFVAAYLAVRFLTKYFEHRTLNPFAIYCIAAGLASLAWLTLR
ncbi:undecaprenyl-diphosphate phosphatase [Dactylosporangium sp. NPDC048998]|uniref:undecaprenyl-diphosphate phosphatase n=1 Tax=Dactylosporangium sp. NPDC048998 TaxID=3363976 RepID=UPI0037120CE6